MKRAIATAAALVGLMACAAREPDRYYTLSPPAIAPALVNGMSGPPLYIELAPVAVPERLARPQLVVRKSGPAGAEVQLLEQHRWPASFDKELRDALAAGIAAQLGAIDVSQGGRPGTQPVWRIAVQLRQFDLVQDTRVDADASWVVRRSDSADGKGCRMSTSEPVEKGIAALARGAQTIVLRMANAIAYQLKAWDANLEADCSG